MRALPKKKLKKEKKVDEEETRSTLKIPFYWLTAWFAIESDDENGCEWESKHG